MNWMSRRIAALGRAFVGAAPALVLLGVGAPAMALDVPEFWKNFDAGTAPQGLGCASCHDVAGNNYRPIYGLGPSAALTSNLGTSSAFHTYVTGLNMNATMNNLTLSQAGAIRPYLLQRLFGEITGSPALDGVAAPDTSYAFPATLVGAGNTLVLTLHNHRGGAISYAAPSGIGTTSASNFWYDSETCSPRSIPGGGSCSLTVHFTPVSMGAKTATLTLTIAGYAHDISLSGLGQARQFQVSPPVLSPTAIVGSFTNAGTTATVTNTGNIALTLGTLSFSGPQASEFTLDASSTCANGSVLAASGSCQAVVRFAPSATGSRQATLTISHNAPQASGSVTLSGTGNPVPVPTINSTAPSPVAFGDVQLGSNDGQSFTITNTGTATLNFSAFNFSGAAAGDYSRSGDCSTGTPLAIGASCTVTVTFAPAALGVRAASLSVVSNASNNPYLVSLTGNGVPVPAPVVTLSPLPPLPVDFANQAVGGLYPDRVITLTNSGTASLSLASVNVTGAGFAIVANTCGTSLAPSASCPITVRFTPVAANTGYNGTVTITSNAAGSPHQVDLTGQGVAGAAPVMIWSPAVASLDFATVNVGSASATQTATLRNQGPGGATIQLVNAVGVDAANFSVTLSGCTVGGILYEGDTCDVQVQFAPGSAGDKAASVQFASTGSAPPTLALTGTGSSGALPVMALSEGVMSFGGVRVGARSSPLPVVLRNNGTASMRVTAMSVTGPYRLESDTCPDLPADLVAGASCTVRVVYQPDGTGTQEGRLSITSNGSITPAEVVLTGEGEPKAESSGGGCAMAQGRTPADPTLWLLVGGAAGVLWARRRQAVRGQVRSRRGRP